MTDTIWATEPKIFTVWSLTGKVCHSLVQGFFGSCYKALVPAGVAFWLTDVALIVGWPNHPGLLRTVLLLNI